MAKRIDAITGTQAAASEALAQFAANGQIAGASVERFTTLALKLEKETGQAVQETVKQFAELGRAPAEASAKLNESTNHLTTSIYQQIRALEEQGRTADAAALAQKAYADALDQRLGQVQNRLGYVERGWRGLIGAAKDAWDAMLNVGRPDTLQEQLDTARAELERRTQRGPVGPVEALTGAHERGNQRLRDRIAFLGESLRLEGRVADSQKTEAERTRARIQFDKEGEKFLSQRARMEEEIAKARQVGATAGASQAEIEKRIADIRAKYTPKSSKPSEVASLGVDKAQLGLEIDAIRNASEQRIGIYTQSEKILESVRAAGIISEKEYFEAKRGFLNLERDTRVGALDSEIKALTDEKERVDAELRALEAKKAKPGDINSKKTQQIDLEKKLGDAISKREQVEVDAAARGEVLANQQTAALKRLEASYVTARQAAEDYLQTLTRQQERTLAGVGQGTRRRDFDAGINQIEDRYAGQRRDLENQRALLEFEGKFTDEARKQHAQRLALIDEFQGKAIDSYRDYYARLTEQQGDWTNGLSESLNNYLDNVANISKRSEDLFDGVFGNIEDAFVKLSTTGTLSFKDLLNSIAAEITRFSVKSVMGDLIGGLKGGLQGGGAGVLGQIGSALGLGGSTDPSSKGATNGMDVASDLAGRASGVASEASRTAALTASTAAITAETAARGASTAAESAATAAISAASASSAAALATLTAAASSASAALAAMSTTSAGSAGGDALGTFISALSAGGRATGGPVSAGQLYEVNERGPEVLTVSGRSYLMTGDQSGTVTPLAPAAGRAAGGDTYNIQVALPPGANRDTGMQIGASIRRQLAHAGRRQG
jgi:lambda family phage tail tape measure protein